MEKENTRLFMELALLGVILFCILVFNIFMRSYFFRDPEWKSLDSWLWQVSWFLVLFGICGALIVRNHRNRAEIKRLQKAANEAKAAAKRTRKVYSYFCPSCLYQTNKFQQSCPKCKGSELRSTA